MRYLGAPQKIGSLLRADALAYLRLNGEGEVDAEARGLPLRHLVVDGEEQTRDVIVLPERVVTNWSRADGDRLVLDDLKDVREDLPDHLVVGTGAYGQMRPNPEPVDELRREGIKVEALRTAEAVRRYGELDPRQTAAALHPTCAPELLR